MDHLLFKSAAWRQRTASDVYGQPSYAAAQNIKIRFENQDRELKLSPEQVIHISAKIFIAGKSQVQDNDQVIIDSVKYRVVKTERCRMVTGVVDHVEALLSEER